ncbi:hypothetical protein [Kitasatospora sp. NPDC059327]|uniref:hypothetical protein n=1 Tax=Kitasatospora sp. NPDC059327 TaxID=3346803 RepID=UPI0036C4898E
MLVTSAALGALIQGIGQLTRNGWQANLPRGTRRAARALTNRRRRRWHKVDDAHREAWPSRPSARARGRPVPEAPRCSCRTGSRTEPPPRSGAWPATGSVSAGPARPTWIADRVRAMDLRVLAAHELDLESAWPRPWLVLPDAARTELRTARSAYDEAAGLDAWSLPYLVLGAAGGPP